MTTKPEICRADRMDSLLESYCWRGATTENLIDLLADAMHWCFLYGRSFDEALDTARMHFDAETPARPAGRMSPMGEQLFNLAKTALNFANEHTEVLDFDEYATVSEIETKLLAFGNLLETSDRDAFLKDELRMATETLAELARRKGIKAG